MLLKYPDQVLALLFLESPKTLAVSLSQRLNRAFHHFIVRNLPTTHLLILVQQLRCQIPLLTRKLELLPGMHFVAVCHQRKILLLELFVPSCCGSFSLLLKLGHCGLVSSFRFMLCFGDCIPHLCIINHVVHDVDLLHKLTIVLVHAEVRAITIPYGTRSSISRRQWAAYARGWRQCRRSLWYVLHGLVWPVVRSKFHGFAHALIAEGICNRTRLPAYTADNL